MALNKAYGDVGSSVIVTNVLRARDRWPTSYTTLTAINSTPSLTRASDINLNPLGLGNPSGPFQSTTSKLSSSSKAFNSYSVTPYRPKEDTKLGLLDGVPARTFQSYMKKWPNDVALLLFVDGFEYNGDYTRNDGENIRGFINALATTFGVQSFQKNSFDIGKNIDIKIEGSDLYLRLISSEDLRFTSSQTAISRKARLRSLDDMIYYLGESIRTEQYPVKIECDVWTQRGWQKDKLPGKIFAVHPIDYAMPVAHAVKVHHAQETYVALPSATQVRSYDSCLRERTGTIVSLLNQIVIRSQDPRKLEQTNTNLIVQ